MRAIYTPRQRRTRARRALSVLAYIGFLATAVAFIITAASVMNAQWSRATFTFLLAYILLQSSTVLKDRGDGL